jgi:hypothetical protein
MKFLLMCCFDEDRWSALPEGERARIMDDYRGFEQDIVKSGHFVATAKLHPTAAAVTVREGNGKRSVTDGPFAETKEQLGGIHLIECESLEEAIAIAGRIPTLPSGGAIEVRPLMRFAGK